MQTAKYKEVSTRLIRPTRPEICIDLISQYVQNWQSEYEMGDVVVYNDGLAQYLLCDQDGHQKFYAALILGKPSLRCRLAGDENEPENILESDYKNRLTVIGQADTPEKTAGIEKLIRILSAKNYKFT